MIHLRITADGAIRGLWSDEVDWHRLGPVAVQRASHLEFDGRRQVWCVHARRAGWLGRLMDRISCGRPVLHRARRRAVALAWETAYFGPGGRGWPEASVSVMAPPPASPSQAPQTKASNPR